MIERRWIPSWILGAGMNGIFINYRRDDSEWVARSLYNRLEREFDSTHVFMDVEDIREPGENFVEAIETSLKRCAAMVALIGPKWSTGADGRSRIHDPRDFVRMEIATALARNVRVIPVLVNGAKMPDDGELPPELAGLTERQAVKLNHDEWERDVARLVDALAKLSRVKRRKPGGGSGWSIRTVVGAAVVGAIVAVGVVAWALGNFFAFDPEGVEIDPRRAAISTLPAVDVPGGAAAARDAAGVGAVTPSSTDTAPSPAALDDSIVVRAAATPALAPQSAPVPNVAGIWFDDNGASVQITQSGNALEVSQLDPFTGSFTIIGSGAIDGNQVDVSYSNQLGISGRVRAVRAPDGRHLNGIDTNMLGIALPTTWHYEHLPGQ
jgi:hypothetical protein